MRLTDYWMARLMLCSYVFMSCMAALLDSPTARLLAISFDSVWWLVPAVALLSAVGLIDLLINDFLPVKFTLLSIHDRRHLLYIAIAFGSMGISGVIATTEGWSPLLLKYWLDATFAAGLCFLEMFPRHRNKKVCT